MATPEDLAETVKAVEELDRRIIASETDIPDLAALTAPGCRTGTRRQRCCGKAAMDWLVGRQERVEDGLAARHLAGAPWSFTYLLRRVRGADLPAGAIGHPKDWVRGRQ
jgi:hypothetical protein